MKKINIQVFIKDGTCKNMFPVDVTLKQWNSITALNKGKKINKIVKTIIAENKGLI